MTQKEIIKQLTEINALFHMSEEEKEDFCHKLGHNASSFYPLLVGTVEGRLGNLLDNAEERMEKV